MTATTRSVRRSKRPTPPDRKRLAGVRAIEQALRPSGEPVIGLHLFMAYGLLVRSMRRGSRFATIRPASIGVPALLQVHPGLSQTELADLLGVERVTAGVQVGQCVEEGLVRRQRSPVDKRKYQLYITGKGKTYLARVAALIPLHEQHLFGCLSAREREGLYRAMVRLIDGASKDGYCK